LISFLSGSAVEFPSLLIGLCFILVLLGIGDDLNDLSASFRVLVQIIVGTIMAVMMDVRIENIGSIVGGEPVQLEGVASVVFTVLCVVGVINAINMIDGLDGLCGSILLVSFGVLAVLAYQAGSDIAGLLFSVCAALLAFLIFNARVFKERATVFMGDSGSMFLGLILVWVLVEMTQGQTPVLSAVSAGWIFGLPLLETVAVMIGRMVDKKSPFTAGRDHLHHKLLDAEFSVKQTVAIMVAVHASIVAIGFVFAKDAASETVLFWLFVFITVLYFLLLRNGYALWRSRARQIKQP
jgi:UDP-GlcNAc:undecaprenyl-phosphate GlcNAc-1-phosphate transferase